MDIENVPNELNNATLQLYINNIENKAARESLKNAKKWGELGTDLYKLQDAAQGADNFKFAQAAIDALTNLLGITNPLLKGNPLISPIGLFNDGLNKFLKIGKGVAEELGGKPITPSKTGAPNGPGGPYMPGSELDPYIPGGELPAGEAATPPRKDPLAFDLDGDGIETTSTRNGSVILFDFDGDGVKSGTGWIKPDDGWLVIDKNNNGIIDNGNEMFGVDTVKKNGSLAADGFDALKDIDTNSDGKVDSSDNTFTSLRIWRDLNQDGISQAGELKKLSETNIKDISTNSQSNVINLGNGNVQTASGTFSRINGSLGSTSIVNDTAVNLDLMVNTFYRSYTNQVALTAQAINLPDIYGSGRVRDLSEAISNSSSFGDLVASYVSQTSRESQIGMLDQFIESWANTSDMKSLKQQADLLKNSGVEVNYNIEGLVKGSEAYNEFLRQLGIVERFMGFTYAGENGQARLESLNTKSGKLSVSLNSFQTSKIKEAYSLFKIDIYESLATRSRLQPYIMAMFNGLSWNEDHVWVNAVPFEQAFDNALAKDAKNGIIDLIEFVSATGGNKAFSSIHWNIESYLFNKLSNLPDFVDDFSEVLSKWSVNLSASSQHSLVGSIKDDLLVGTNGNDNIIGADGNDIIVGKAGNDTLDGRAGNDTYVFGRASGNDTINESYDSNVNTDTILLESGINPADVTVKRDGTGDDLLLTIAGATNQLRVKQFFYQDGKSPYAVEQIKFADGTTWNVATINAKAILGTAGNDSIIGYASADLINGGAGNDTLDGRAGNDISQGLAGIDSFNDTVGNNLIDGGIGNDIITTGSGRDLLIGGVGNDTITSGTGYDVISFNKGDGVDIISASTGTDNTLSLGGNFAYSDLSLTKTGNNLILKMGTTDQITLKDWYASGTTNKSVVNLQVIAEAIQGFSLGGANALSNNKVETFNFTNLVAAFDTAGATANWQLTDARLTAHLQAGSDSAAIGGDLAYQYGKNSNLTGMGLLNAQSVISNASFGQAAQALNNPSVWQAELVKLG